MCSEEILGDQKQFFVTYQMFDLDAIILDLLQWLKIEVQLAHPRGCPQGNLQTTFLFPRFSQETKQRRRGTHLNFLISYVLRGE